MMIMRITLILMTIFGHVCLFRCPSKAVFCCYRFCIVTKATLRSCFFLSLFDRAAEFHDILNAYRILRIYRTGIFKPGLSTSRLILLTWLRRIKESSFHCIYITTVSTRSSSSCVYVIATHTKFSSDAYVSMIFHFICVYSWHRFVVW